MSTSSPEGLAAWVQERFPLPLFAAGALALTLASGVGTRELAPSALALRFGVALCALFGLRLWDDLEDRDRDQVEHPERVLVRAQALGPFRAAAALALAMALAGTLLTPGSFDLLVLMGLLAGLGASYRAKAQRSRSGPWLLLLKYPLLVLALRGVLDGKGGAAMAVLYGAASLDEASEGWAFGPLRSSGPRRAALLGICVLLMLAIHQVRP